MCESKPLREEIDVSQMGSLLAFPAITSLQGELAHGVVFQRKVHEDRSGKVGGIHGNDGRESTGTDDFCQNAFEHVSHLIHHLIHQFGSENTTDGRHLQSTGTEAIGRKKVTKQTSELSFYRDALLARSGSLRDIYLWPTPMDFLSPKVSTILRISWAYEYQSTSGEMLDRWDAR